LRHDALRLAAAATGNGLSKFEPDMDGLEFLRCGKPLERITTALRRSLALRPLQGQTQL